MRRLTSGFALEVFDRRNARSDRLSEFLALYVQHFGPEHRTPTNELLDFLENQPADRLITYFGLTYDDEPCGFATLMLYPAGPIGIIDHLVVAPNLRGYGGFFSFCDLIAKFLEKRRLTFDHIVAEVMLDEHHMASTIKPMVLLRLMRFVGFRVARSVYWAPDPSIISDPDGCRAALLVASQPQRDELPAQEFMRMVELIYEVHYARWYERTMLPVEFRRYQTASREFLSRVRAEVTRAPRIILNGMKNLDLPFSLNPDGPASTFSLFYIMIIAVPAAVALGVGLAQELWVTILAVTLVCVAIGVFAIHPRLRRYLLRAFQLTG